MDMIREFTCFIFVLSFTGNRTATSQHRLHGVIRISTVWKSGTTGSPTAACCARIHRQKKKPPSCPGSLDLPTRATALRRLAEIGLKSKPKWSWAHAPTADHGRPREDAQLLALLESKMDRDLIARKLKRTVTAISKRLSVLRATGVKVRK
jgi:hypothetical protein